MANTSLAAAHSDLVSLLAGSAIAGVTKVYGYEPGAETVLDRCVTVAATGMDPDFFEFAVRVYVRVSDTTQGQTVLYAACDAIDGRLRSTAQFGPSDWSFDYSPEMGALVATNTIRAGREDYY